MRDYDKKIAECNANIIEWNDEIAGYQGGIRDAQAHIQQLEIMCMQEIGKKKYFVGLKKEKEDKNDAKT